MVDLPTPGRGSSKGREGGREGQVSMVGSQAIAHKAQNDGVRGSEIGGHEVFVNNGRNVLAHSLQASKPACHPLQPR